MIGQLMGRAATLFFTYWMADATADKIQHSRQRLDYGILNKLFGRPVENRFWGTRLQHHVGVAAGLTVTDLASQKIYEALLGEPVTFASNPEAFLLHTFGFIASGVGVYVAADAAFNPQNQGQRWNTFLQNMYATVKGSLVAWYEPLVGAGTAFLLNKLGITSDWLSSFVAATAAYAGVKGFGWNDWGNNLTPHEKRLNNT